jgi:superfamily II DNA/RNA helicase
VDLLRLPARRFLVERRAVVFTEYAHTLEWAQRVLVQQGYGDVLEVIQGSTPTEDRELVRERFTQEPSGNKVRVLLATDAAGEGIDLRDHCHRLINLDIPFNPSRLEQRIGRIDRYGQHETPLVFHLAPDRSSTRYAGDMEFMGRIARKVVTGARDLGSVNQVIAEEIQEHFARSKTGRRRKAAVDGNSVINKALAGGLDLNSRLTQLEQGYAESRAQLHLEPANLRRAVDTALRISHQPTLIEAGDDRTDAAVLTLPLPKTSSALVGAARGCTRSQRRSLESVPSRGCRIAAT